MSKLLTASKSVLDALDYVRERIGDESKDYIALDAEATEMHGTRNIEYRLYVSPLKSKRVIYIKKENLYEVLVEFEAVVDGYLECRARMAGS